MHDQVCGAGADAELFVIGDRRVHRVERQQQVGHHSAVANRGFESIRTKRLAAERAVHVGDDQQHELDVLRRSKINGSKRSLDLGFRHRDATSPSVAARRSIIMSSSPSELVKAGAADYIAKPWDDARLLTTVRNLLDLRIARAEARALRTQRTASQRANAATPSCADP